MRSISSNSAGRLKHIPDSLQQHKQIDQKKKMYQVMLPTDTQIWRASAFVLMDTLVSQGVSALVPTLFLIIVTKARFGAF